MDDDVSPFLSELESEVQTEAAGNPNNKMAFNGEAPSNSVVETVEVTDEDLKKYLTEGQRNSLPKALQEGIARKKKISESEEANMPSFENMRSEYDNPETIPEVSADEPLPESPEELTPETEIPPEVAGPPETFEPNLPEPADVTLLAERLSNQDQEVRIASMTQRQFEDWLFPEDGESSDWASGQVALARILANLKAAGYDANTLTIDETLFPRYLQVASALWSRQNLVETDRESVLLKLENAPASQIVAMLTATADAIPITMAAELFSPVEVESEPTNYLPYAAVGITTIAAMLIPMFWKK
ncbi:MAG: hypothetical protein CMA72_08430 [Euryarchaeota archaeon]|jgi:hypothetical protein|nr:hypothetical protein [Euryarchaeota archaeon]|tara:strand:+ start:2709 stop:3617 length:909 start_codon:yes stop_codon:yes gene_type:complete